MSHPDDGPETLTDDEIQTHRFDAAAVAGADDAGDATDSTDDSGDVSDATDTGDDSGDATDTGDDSTDGS
jgi:hypothetical protein